MRVPVFGNALSLIQLFEDIVMDLFDGIAPAYDGLPFFEFFTDAQFRCLIAGDLAFAFCGVIVVFQVGMDVLF